MWLDLTSAKRSEFVHPSRDYEPFSNTEPVCVADVLVERRTHSRPYRAMEAKSSFAIVVAPLAQS